jgi:hypothetical protein
MQHPHNDFAATGMHARRIVCDSIHIVICMKESQVKFEKFQGAQDLIPSAFVALRAGTTTLLKILQIRAQRRYF